VIVRHPGDGRSPCREGDRQRFGDADGRFGDDAIWSEGGAGTDDGGRVTHTWVACLLRRSRLQATGSGSGRESAELATKQNQDAGSHHGARERAGKDWSASTDDLVSRQRP
jgi:hypothetical protein